MSEGKGADTGTLMAEAIVAFAHLFYNKPTSVRVIKAAIKRLTEGLKEFD